jgi:hypothetical protein
MATKQYSVIRYSIRVYLKFATEIDCKCAYPFYLKYHFVCHQEDKTKVWDYIRNILNLQNLCLFNLFKRQNKNFSTNEYVRSEICTVRAVTQRILYYNESHKVYSRCSSASIQTVLCVGSGSNFWQVSQIFLSFTASGPDVESIQPSL